MHKICISHKGLLECLRDGELVRGRRTRFMLRIPLFLKRTLLYGQSDASKSGKEAPKKPIIGEFSDSSGLRGFGLYALRLLNAA